MGALAWHLRRSTAGIHFRGFGFRVQSLGFRLPGLGTEFRLFCSILEMPSGAGAKLQELLFCKPVG